MKKKQPSFYKLLMCLLALVSLKATAQVTVIDSVDIPVHNTAFGSIHLDATQDTLPPYLTKKVFTRNSGNLSNLMLNTRAYAAFDLGVLPAGSEITEVFLSLNGTAIGGNGATYGSLWSFSYNNIFLVDSALYEYCGGSGFYNNLPSTSFGYYNLSNGNNNVQAISPYPPGFNFIKNANGSKILLGFRYDGSPAIQSIFTSSSLNPAYAGLQLHIKYKKNVAGNPGNPPTFVNGTKQNISVCSGSNLDLKNVLAVNDANIGYPITYHITQNPIDTVGSLSFSIDNATVSSNSATVYLPAGNIYVAISRYAIKDSFKVSVDDGNGGTATTTVIVTVKQQANYASDIIGNPTFCKIPDARLFINNGIGGGVWSSSNSSVASVVSNSGLVTAKKEGTTILTYTVYNAGGCSNSTSQFLTINLPVLPNITGPTSICRGLAGTLSNTVTGGHWESLNNKIIMSNSTGLFLASFQGTGIVQYTVTTPEGCVSSVYDSIAVNPNPANVQIKYADANVVNPQAGTVGNGNYCNNRTFFLAGYPSGGLFVSSDISKLTVNNATGETNTIANGNIALTYTYADANGCVASKTMTGKIVTCAAHRGQDDNEIKQIVNFSMYPNPAHSVINLQVNSLYNAGNIIITDLYGNQLKKQVLGIGTNTINVSKLVRGVYVISVIIDASKQTQKLIVE